MSSAAPATTVVRKPAPPPPSAMAACFLAGVCTYLNMYCTQPLLPYLQRVFHASEIDVSMTVSATILAVALVAPFVGLMAESIGRKKVIVPSLYALTVPTMLVATSHTLKELIFWRFMQGLFVPGVVTVIMAYIVEEFAGAHVGRAMSAYVSGSVLGGFLGRYISGLVAHHFRWEDAFIVIGFINLAGAVVVQRALPKPRHFVRATNVRNSLAEMLHHLRNPQLLAVYGMAFAVLFSLVGAFTYTNFHLARPPYRLNSAQLGSVFFVYLLGVAITPLSGRFLDHYGMRRTAVLATGFTTTGLLLTLCRPLPLIIAGLALFSSGIFIFQAVGTVQTGIVAGRSRSSAAGLYVTFYYIGGSLGAIVTGWAWGAGAWPACVWLLLGVGALALALGFESSRKTAVEP
ncbi:MAG: MFS transporter [Candidatus Korobacteraceae bacterium]|jgi:MFS transporter, YNFM family, putative membrane transport protein